MKHDESTAKDRTAAEATTESKQTTGSKKNRFSGTWVVIERLLLISGIAALALYGIAEIRAVVLSKLAVKQFEASKRSASEPAAKATPASVESSEGKASQPDFVSWSQKRVQEYQQSLTQNLAPPIGLLRIPKINLEVPVLEGTDDLTLNRGVGRIEGTGRLGEQGNIGLAGHRDGFFRGLKDVKLGDQIELEGSQKTETYIVDQIQIVKPTDVSVLGPRSKPSITLVTCYPFYFVGSAPERFIVHASRMDSGLAQGNKTAQGS